MRQINFSLIFFFGLSTVFFTLENTENYNGECCRGCSTHSPLAALLLLASGVGAAAAWLFATWSGMLNNVERFSNASEFEAQQVRIQELEVDLQPLQGHGADAAWAAAAVSGNRRQQP